ncbi:MAG: tetratricopeptide repeat protein [Ginsengibacter sp.]
MKFFLLILCLRVPFCLLAQTDSPEQLISRYTLQIKLYPDSISNYILRSKAYNEKGDFNAALADCNKVLQREPNNKQAMETRADAYYFLQKFDSSLADINLVLKQDLKDTSAWNRRGMNYYWLNQLDKAIADFTEALRLDSKNKTTWFNRGNTYYWQSKFDEAIGDISESISYDPEFVRAIYIRGMSYYYQSKYQNAIKDFTRTLQLDPRNDDALNARGICYSILHQNDSSLADLSKALQINPGNLYAWNSRGNLYKYMGEYELSIADFTQAILGNPKNADALYNRGNVYAKLNKQEEAIKDYTEVLKLEPGSLDALSNRGDAFVKTGQYDLALKDYNLALQKAPKNVDVKTSRAICYKKMGSKDLALKDFNEALQIDPKSFFALTQRGDFFTSVFDYDAAINDYGEAIRINPTSTEPRNNRGNIFFEQKKYDLAASDYTMVIQQDPQNAAGYSNRGYVYKLQKKYDLALLDLTTAISLAPSSGISWNKRGSVYMDLLQYDSALHDFNKALRLDATDTTAFNNKGLLYYNQHKYDEALVEFNDALKINSRYADALNNRALVYYRMGNYEKAVSDFKSAINFKPGYSTLIINLVLVYLSNNQLKEGSELYNQYREKKLTSYIEESEAWAFLKNYITACCDYIVKADYKNALPLLEASLKEYKETNETQPGMSLSLEYSNVVFRTAFVCEKLAEKNKAVEYYRVAQIINPKLEGISEKIASLSGSLSKAAVASNEPAQIKLLSPRVLSGTTVEKTPGDATLMFVSGTIDDKAGISSVSVNGTGVTTLRDDGYFEVKVKNDVNDINIQSTSKSGKINSFVYQLKNSAPARNEESEIPPIPVAEKPRFHAVLIACSNYNDPKLKKLPNTIIEAREYKNILMSEYGFEEKDIDTLYDKGYMEIVAALYQKLKSLNKNDNLVLFFAGHGTYKETGDDIIGYWIPLNATAPEIDYISNQKLDEIVAGCAAKHILLISDACYSAAMRSVDDKKDNDELYLPKYKQYEYKSRQILTSGGLEKVPEKSIFIEMVMKTLEQKDNKYLSAKELYNYIFTGVKNQTNNQPELNLFGKDGNEGGQFYFIRNN